MGVKQLLSSNNFFILSGVEGQQDRATTFVLQLVVIETFGYLNKYKSPINKVRWEVI